MVRLVVAGFLAAFGAVVFGAAVFAVAAFGGEALRAEAFRAEAFGADGVGSSPGSSGAADVLTEVSGALSAASPIGGAGADGASPEGALTEGTATEGGPAGRLAARLLVRVTAGGAVVSASADGGDVSSSSMVLLACLRALGAARRRSVRCQLPHRYGDALAAQACGGAPASG